VTLPRSAARARIRLVHAARAAPPAVCSRFQYLLDKTVVFPMQRWAGLGVGLLLYGLRVWWLDGWFIVTYGLGIFLLNLLIGFMSPPVRRAARSPAIGWQKGGEVVGVCK
jgi:hypothetical protein